MPRSTLLKGLVGALAGGVWFVTTTAGTSVNPIATATSTADVSSLNSESARERIATLRAEIARHDTLYFKKAAPEISDAAYDALKRELRALEQTFPSEAATLPTSLTLVDDHTDGFSKAAHRAPMHSLDKAYSEDELRAFCARVISAPSQPVHFVVEPKIDGIAVSAVYEHGRFVRAVTRGNGHEGDDITANALAIRSLPHALRDTAPDGARNTIPDVIELRGEIYLARAEFLRLNREREAAGDPPFAHPRNAAAGTIKSRDPRETAERRLDVVFYGWGACEPASAAPATQQAFHSQAKAWGLPVFENCAIASDTDAVWAAVQTLGKNRASLLAPIDGAVIKLDNVVARDQFGYSDQAPRWAFAYKYAPERVTTQITGITVQVGRTGLLTPVAELMPATLGGSTIARASLHNRSVIARLGVRIGDFVFVEKSGEIIPEVVGVDATRRPAPSEPYVFPSKCPSCGTAVIADGDAVALRCSNSTGCPAQLRQRLAHFAGKSCVAIGGLGDATIAELVASGHVRAVADLYKLRIEDLVALPNIGAKSAARLLTEIERSRRAELWRFINGLSIPRVGPATSKILARHCGSLEKLASAQSTELPAELGAATQKAVLTFFASPENRVMVIELGKAVQPSASSPDNRYR